MLLFDLEPAGPRGLGDPYEYLRDPSNPAPPIAFLAYGVLFPGEKGEPDTLLDPGLPDGEFEKLPILLAGELFGVGVLANRGGVL